MSAETSDENWLHGEIIVCPHCQHQLYRVDRSPFYDEWQLYCNLCAGRVKVSYFDSTVGALEDEMGNEAGQPLHERQIALLRAIEMRLKPCSCGGHYQYDAPRRCHICQGVVISDDSGVDLWPELFGTRDDPTQEEIAMFEHFDAAYVRRDDIWK